MTRPNCGRPFPSVTRASWCRGAVLERDNAEMEIVEDRCRTCGTLIGTATARCTRETAMRKDAQETTNEHRRGL
jgi:hypothetical protein